MVNDMEMYLEQVLKKTNPEKYIEILEQDREDFAKEIVELNQIIDKAIEYIENNLLYSEEFDYDDEDNLQFQGAYDYKAREDLLNILKGSDKE